jgi:hypothetical protein
MLNVTASSDPSATLPLLQGAAMDAGYEALKCNIQGLQATAMGDRREKGAGC